MTDRHPTDEPQPSHEPAPEDGLPADDPVLVEVRRLARRVDRLETGLERLLAQDRPPPASGETIRIERPPVPDPESRQRHARIAERVAERALATGQLPIPRDPADGSPIEPDPTDPRPTGPGRLDPGRPLLSADTPSGPVPRRRRPVAPVAAWVGVVVAIIGGVAFWLQRDREISAELRSRVAETYQDVIDGEADETITVTGQVPLPPDETLAGAGPLPGDDAAIPVATRDDAAMAVAAPPADDQEADPAATGAVPGSAEAPAGATRAEAPAGGTGAEAPAGGTGAEAPAGGTGTEPTTADDGPAVAAGPPGEVEEAAPVALDPARAPLPEEAAPELEALARRALSGNPEAQHDLATVYALGNRVPQNFERAAYWYGQSADAGIVNARYNLGVLQTRGMGVPRDVGSAFRQFRQAAEAGHPDAQNALGLAYLQGNGVERDVLRAAAWFQEAHAAGNPQGAYNLGRIFEQGVDGAPDLTAAAGWYQAAADAGDADAAAALERVAEAVDEIPEEPPPMRASLPPPDRPAEAAALDPAEAASGEALDREAIRELQRLLARLGHDPGPADGLMGSRTAAAIESFQEARGLTVTGEPTTGLLNALRQVAEQR